MDKQERGMLLVEKEELENKISNLKNLLAKDGKFLIDIGKVISSDPASLVFTNAPGNLGTHSGLSLRNAFNWNDIPNITLMAENIQQLRDCIFKLSETSRRLDSVF